MVQSCSQDLLQAHTKNRLKCNLSNSKSLTLSRNLSNRSCDSTIYTPNTYSTLEYLYLQDILVHENFSCQENN